MKIAYIFDAIYPYVTGGSEKRFWEIAKRLAQKGHEVHVIGMKWWEGNDLIVKEKVYVHGICRAMPIYEKTSGTRSVKQTLYFSYKLLPFLMSQKFDIIDCNSFPYLTFFPVKIYSFFKRVPFVITWQEVWGNHWLKYLGGVKGLIGWMIEKTVIKFSPHIIAHTSRVKEALIKNSKRIKRIVVIPNGVDINLIEKIPANEEQTDLIFAGRLIKDKNIDILIKTVAILKKSCDNIQCLIIGEGPEKNNLINLCSGLGLDKNITFLNFVDYSELISRIKASKIFVLPSTREGFGIVVIEAMACGLPVITVNHPLNASIELIKNGKDGFVCEFNEKDIAEKVSKLIENPILRDNIAINAKNSIKGYDWNNIADQNEKFYAFVQTTKARSLLTNSLAE